MNGGLRLPRCAVCGAWHWPAREICPSCHALPDGAMTWKDAPGGATVVAATRLHVSLDPAFDGRLPLPLVSLQLDAGPAVIAFDEGTLAAGDRAEVRLEEDGAGRPVLVAGPGGGRRA